MPAPRWKPLCRVPRRRAAAAAALLTYLAAAFGFPLPAAPSRKDASVPFPCQDHPCGCQTAEQCWSACCCFTPEERWAWAAAHDVTPPAYAERPAGGWRQTPLREQDSGEGPRGNRRCCQGKHEGAGERRPAANGHACCGGGPAPPDCCRPNPDKPGTVAAPLHPAGARWALGIAALKCRGLATLWAAAGAALPPPEVVCGEPALPPAGWLRAGDESPRASLSRPPDPPPRRSYA